MDGDPIDTFSNSYTSDMDFYKQTDYDKMGEGAASYKGESSARYYSLGS